MQQLHQQLGTQQVRYEWIFNGDDATRKDISGI
jgi:hypothetical protein